MPDEENVKNAEHEEPADEIEGHAKKFHANDDGGADETDKDDEVEAHHHKKNA
jgi:hypothetical protein